MGDGVGVATAVVGDGEGAGVSARRQPSVSAAPSTSITANRAFIGANLSFRNRPKSNPVRGPSGAPAGPSPASRPIISPSRGGDHGLPRFHPARRRRLGGVPARRRSPPSTPRPRSSGRSGWGPGSRSRPSRCSPRTTSSSAPPPPRWWASTAASAASSRASLDHDSGLALLTVEGAGFEPARLARGGGAAARRPRLHAHLHRRQGAARGERSRLLRGALRGVLGVHARPRDHDDHRQPRPRRGAAPRRARARRRHRLPGPRRGRPLQPGHPDGALPRAAGAGSRAASPSPRRSGTPGSASTRRRTTTASPSRASCPAAPPTRPASSGAICSSAWTATPSRTCASSTARCGARAPGEIVGMQVLREESIHVIEVVAGDRYEFYK